MKRKAALIILVLSLSLSSCVYSLFPLYSEETVVFKEELLGKWAVDNDGSYLLFQRPDDIEKTKSGIGLLMHPHGSSSSIDREMLYFLDIYDQSVSSQVQRYEAHMVQLGDDYFLDIFPTSEFGNETMSDNFMGMHSFFKLEASKNELKITRFDLQKLSELFNSNLIRLRHEAVDGTILITAQTEELQQFIERYAKDERVFEDTEIYQRVES